jgi:lycopene cyclase domain-containing protein
MNYYVMLDLLVFAGPLVLSFDRKVAFHKKWPAVFGAIALILVVFGAWDVWKTAAGVWSFNPEFAGTWRLFGLPAGEWLFFIVVPYACLFILACVRAYFKDAELRIPATIWWTAAGLFVVLGIIFIRRTYTGVVFLSVAAAFTGALLLTPASLRSRNYWLAVAITYAPFLLSNGILTGKPVVLYDDTRNLAIRIGSIPLEDFFFSFSMILLSFVFFDRISSRRSAAKSESALQASAEPQPAEPEPTRPESA